MSDETNQTPTPDTPPTAPKPHRGGWPRGRPRRVNPETGGRPDDPIRRPLASARPEPKAGRFDAFKAARADLEYRDYSGDDHFHIDPDVIEKLRREGIALMWVAESVYGNADICKHAISALERNGWQRVENELPEIPVTDIGGQHLYMNSVEVVSKAQRAEKERARDQLAVKEQAWRGGDMNASGARHPSAVRSNRINRTMERIDVPGAERERERDGHGRYR